YPALQRFFHLTILSRHFFLRFLLFRRVVFILIFSPLPFSNLRRADSLKHTTQSQVAISSLFLQTTGTTELPISTITTVITAQCWGSHSNRDCDLLQLILFLGSKSLHLFTLLKSLSYSPFR
ncbi:GSCOCG00007565001-RA-CDS, partial [Cotesia congregata]